MALTTEQAPTGQLKRPHLHFVWKPASQPNASWKGALFGYYWRETPRRLNVVFSVRGIALWAAALSLAAYLLGAAVLVGIWSRNPYNQVGYLDVVLPTRWTELRALRGKGLIAEGVAEIRAKRYATGLMLLARGVAYCPRDFNGRLQLAKIFASIGQLHRAKQLALDGMAYGAPPRGYCDFVFGVTTYLQDYDALLDASLILEKNAPDQLRRESLKWQALAFEKLGRFEELSALRDRSKKSGFNVDVEQSWARAQLAMGRPAVALLEINRVPDQFGLPGERLQLKLDLAVGTKDLAQIESTITEWRSKDPYGPIPRVREIAARIRMKQTERATEALNDFFLHYASDLPSVVYLFRTLVDLEDADWLKAAYAEANASGKIPISASILFIQGLLVCGEIDSAQREFAKVEAFIKNSKADDGQWIIGTSKLISALTSPSATNEAILLDYFATKQAPPDAFRFAWRTLARVQSPLAGELAQLAQNRYPALHLGDPKVMAEWASRQAKEDSISVAPRPSLKEPRPTVPVPLIRAVVSEAQMRVEIAHIDDLLARKAYTEAIDAIRQLERGASDELDRSPLALRRIELHGERRELSELTAAVRLYLQAKSLSLTKLRTLAERWSNAQHRESALVLLREIRNRLPDALWAAELQRQLERDLLVAPAMNIVENRS